MLCSLVQFGPQGLDLPGADCGLQRAVEAAVVQRVQLQLPAEDAEGLQSPLTGGRLHEVLKEHAGLSHALVFRLAHRRRRESASFALRLSSSSSSASVFRAHFVAVSAGRLCGCHARQVLKEANGGRSS